MGKIFAGVLIGIALVGAVLGVSGLVNAQAPEQAQQFGYVDGMMGGRGGGRMGWNDGLDQTGPLHDLMISEWADKLGLSEDVIDQRLADGESLYDIAVSTGMTADEFLAARVEIHTAILDEAVAQGLMTQEQANWMNTRSGRMGLMDCTGTGAGTTAGRFGRGNNSTLQTNP
jgi:hypothetical protein